MKVDSNKYASLQQFSLEPQHRSIENETGLIEILRGQVPLMIVSRDSLVEDGL